ncbi:exported protein, unknown function [Hepatocystis sp. ex Piliocolobus tephrosceles]|nr:exported protein, unknown function [Hepatocystis sp. ex Piliocolobus tephrosceles]
MITTIYKTIIIFFFLWRWTNNIKASNENILRVEYSRSLSELEISSDESSVQTAVADIKNDKSNEISTNVETVEKNKIHKIVEPVESKKNDKNKEQPDNDDDDDEFAHIVENALSSENAAKVKKIDNTEYLENIKVLESDEFNERKVFFLSEMKDDLIRVLSKKNKTKHIIREIENIKERDLLEIYDLIKHVMPTDKYLQTIKRSCDKVKKKHLDDKFYINIYYESITHLLRTYFFLTNKNRKSYLTNNNNKFKTDYLKGFKIFSIIDKLFKTNLLKHMINKEINPTVKMAYSKRLKLFAYAFFYPILTFVASIVILPFGSLPITFSILGLYTFLIIHSNYKLIKDVHFIQRIMQRSELLNREYFS